MSPMEKRAKYKERAVSYTDTNFSCNFQGLQWMAYDFIRVVMAYDFIQVVPH